MTDELQNSMRLGTSEQGQRARLTCLRRRRLVPAAARRRCRRRVVMRCCRCRCPSCCRRRRRRGRRRHDGGALLGDHRQVRVEIVLRHLCAEGRKRRPSKTSGCEDDAACGSGDGEKGQAPTASDRKKCNGRTTRPQRYDSPRSPRKHGGPARAMGMESHLCACTRALCADARRCGCSRPFSGPCQRTVAPQAAATTASSRS